MATQAPEEASLRKIEKAQITWPATKTQMSAAAFLICLSTFIAYFNTLKIGFLLDDYLHIDYAARALRGELAPLLNNFVSNWGGSDIMKSYRPVISLSIFIDYLFFHIHAFGYHFTNIAIFAGCSILVGLITLEITGRLGGRSGALSALWAGLLFSVYPLHAESVAWIIGRVDTVATLFYLASVFCFMRLQLLRERSYQTLSLIFFVLALTSKEIAVSLPLAIALLACLPTGANKARPGDAALPLTKLLSKGRTVILATAPYLITLTLFAIFRQLLLGTIIGGYGSAGPLATNAGGEQDAIGAGLNAVKDILSSLRIFANRESLIKIFVPVSEEYLPVRTLLIPCTGPLIALVAIFILRQLSLYTIIRFRPALLVAPLTAIFWAAMALLPAFQIWHIYPNLVGSRLFFLSSAGLCIALALIALPTVESVNKRTFAYMAWPALIPLALIYVTWFYCLQINLTPWERASELVNNFEIQLKEALSKSHDGRVTILNLPQDYKGAGMIGRKLYLDILNRPPLCGEDLSAKIVTIEPVISGSREYIWPRQLQVAAKVSGPTNVYYWSNESAKLQKFSLSKNLNSAAEKSSEVSLVQSLMPELAKLPVAASGKNAAWLTAAIGSPIVLCEGKNILLSQVTESGAQGADQHQNTKPITVWLTSNYNADDPRNAMVSLLVDDNDIGMGTKCKLLWRDPISKELVGAADAYIDSRETSNAHDPTQLEKYIFYPGRYRNYALHQKPLELGLQFDLGRGAVRFDPSSLQIGADDQLVPVLELEGEQNSLSKQNATRPFLNWNVKALAATNQYDQLRFYVTTKNSTIDPITEYDLFKPAALEKVKPALKLSLKDADQKSNNIVGRLPLAAVLDQAKTADIQGNAGLHQIVLVLTGQDGKISSLPSQPVTVVSLSD